MTAALGFGVSGPLAMRWHPAAATRALIAQALDGGVVHFDTAPFYGEGEGERRLGEALAAAGARVFISTKTGTRRRGRRILKDFSERAIRADVEGSLARLRVGRIDRLYLHGPRREEISAARDTLVRLVEEGKIAQWGVCGEGPTLGDAVAAGAGAVMGAYNVVDRRHEAIFRDAHARGVVVTAIAPLAQALFLRGPGAVRGAADLWRLARAATRGRQRAAAASARAALEAVEGFTPVEAALAFVTQAPFISIACTATTKPAHLAVSLAACGRTLPPVDRVRLEAVGAARP